MKLYFYTLDTYGSNPKGLYLKEAEAIDRAKTYKAANGSFPNYLGTARKDEVGQIRYNCLFLTEPNFEYAKELFRARVEQGIANELEKIEKLKAELKIINDSEE